MEDINQIVESISALLLENKQQKQLLVQSLIDENDALRKQLETRELEIEKLHQQLILKELENESLLKQLAEKR